MPAPISVSIDPSRVKIEPGNSTSATIIVRNRSEEVSHYLLTVDGVPPGWAEITPNQVSAFPLQETRAMMTIAPPPGTPGAVYHLSVLATSQEDASMLGRGAIDLDIPLPVQPEPPQIPVASPPLPIQPRPQSAVQIELAAEPLKDSKLPPPASQWRLSIRNANTVLDTFSFNISGVRPNWVTIDPPAITLKPDEGGTAILTVRPEDGTPGGVYSLKLRAFSHLNLNQRTEMALQVQIKPSVGIKLDISPRDAEAQGKREFQVTLTSDAASNMDIWVDLSASDQDNACDYTFEPSQVFMPAKQTITCRLLVQPHAVLGPNERKTYTVKVLATPRDGIAPTQNGEARLTQIGAVPLNLSIRPQILSGEMVSEYSIAVINPSAVQAMLVLSGEDPAESCDYIFQPSRVTVPSMGQIQVILKVKAHSPFEDEGQQVVPFVISATRVGEMVPAAKIEGKFVQLQLKPIKILLIPPQQSQPGRAQYFVRTRNPRSAPIRIWLEAKDEEDALSFSFQPSEMQLSAGADGMSTLIARPKDKLPEDQQRRVHKFTVTGTIDGSRSAVSANGILAQTRGTEWGGMMGTALKWGFWVLRWLIVIVVLVFLATIFLAGMDRVAERNVQLGRLVYSILSPALIKGLISLSPFSGPAQGIVYLVEGIINAVFQPR